MKKKWFLLILCAIVSVSALEARRGGGRHGGRRHGRQGHRGYRRGHWRGGRGHGWRRGGYWGLGGPWWGPRVSIVAPVGVTPLTPSDFEAKFGYWPTRREFCNWVGWGSRSCRLY